ncbi:MAG: SIS domain-containing protein [Candidatus Sumerlaeota bacterium]|nr:SIS domain-containing protein [Candidatus Sumerlaeota bacterium]
MRILDEARHVLRVELRALQSTIDALDERFERAMRLLRQRRGKIVVTGVGKSGLIAQKIAATFNSTGSVAVFMHKSERRSSRWWATTNHAWRSGPTRRSCWWRPRKPTI